MSLLDEMNYAMQMAQAYRVSFPDARSVKIEIPPTVTDVVPRYATVTFRHSDLLDIYVPGPPNEGSLGIVGHEVGRYPKRDPGT